MTSKKRLTLVSLVLAGVLIAVTALRMNRAPALPEVEPAFPIAAETPAVTTLRTLVAKPFEGSHLGERPAANAASPECASLETAILALALDDFDYPPRIARLPNPAGCKPAEPRAARILAYYSAKCADSFVALPAADLPEDEWKTKLGECQLATLLTRSTFAVLARGKKEVREIEDMRELADRLIASFGGFFAELSTAEMAEMREIADRMIELDPTLIPAHKAGAMAAMLESVGAKEKDPKATPDWADLDARVREIQNRSPEDPDLDTFRRIADTEGMDPERVKQDSLSRLSRKPDDWRENQVLAWANWKLGRKDESRAALKRALELNPGEKELQENWQVTQRPGSKPEDFKISMRVGVSFTEMLK